MSAIISTIIITTLLLNIGLVVLFITNFKKYTKKWDELPSVSVLLAARNEEANIERCLNSLASLDYPIDKLQILVGDDCSEDNTWQIIDKFQSKYPFIQSFHITEQIGEQKGKANVLAQLAHKATGNFFLVTDADMLLPPSWIHGMLSAMEKKVGLAIGVTHDDNNKMQNIDWLFALGMVKVITDLGLPVTGMGNNMIVSKEAYKSVGGYESLPFSITEDLELFKHIKKKGHECKHLFQKEVLGKTLPIKGLFNLLNQRKRWMKGAYELQWHMIILLIFQACFYPCLIALLFVAPLIASVIFTTKIILQFFFMMLIRKRLNLSFNLLSALLYEFYSIFISIFSVLYYLLPVKIIWKGREY
ncbi:MAG: glycosyltransferase [Cyclobacteriaceae bacterium]|nr:glycosyltransferase [Cyclobacteriaceae bacterium]